MNADMCMVERIHILQIKFMLFDDCCLTYIILLSRYQVSPFASILPALLRFILTGTFNEVHPILTFFQIFFFLLLISSLFLADSTVNRYPVQAGDAIWMAPFVPQW